MDNQQLPIALTDCGDCRHQRPINRCPTCIMRNFLLIRNHLAKQGYPFLVRDVCTIIMSKLPPYRVPPKGIAYRLRDCGRSCRVPFYPNRSAMSSDAICGMEDQSPFIDEYVLYCTQKAITPGACGTWTCIDHCKRHKIIIDKLFIKDT
jgi:hypothetical protein